MAQWNEGNVTDWSYPLFLSKLWSQGQPSDDASVADNCPGQQVWKVQWLSTTGRKYALE